MKTLNVFFFILDKKKKLQILYNLPIFKPLKHNISDNVVTVMPDAVVFLDPMVWPYKNRPFRLQPAWMS